MVEMARPNTVIPDIIGSDLTVRYLDLLNKVTKSLKYGVDSNGEPLIDSDGDVAAGLDDSVIQDRKIRYFLLILNGFYPNLKRKSQNRRGTFQKLLKRSHDLFVDILVKNDRWKKVSTTTKLTTATALTIKNRQQYFESLKFERDLLDPTILADYLNLFRTKDHRTSVKAANQREMKGKLGVYDLDAIRANTRDDVSRANIDKGYEKVGKAKKRIAAWTPQLKSYD